MFFNHPIKKRWEPISQLLGVQDGRFQPSNRRKELDNAHLIFANHIERLKKPIPRNDPETPILERKSERLQKIQMNKGSARKSGLGTLKKTL